MNTPFFSCQQARELDLVDYLASLGHQPRKVTGSDYWYCSPFREEKTPSFKIDRKKNLWYDHGIGKGGNLIDFGVLFHRCSVAELLQKLSGKACSIFSFHPPKETVKDVPVEQEKIRIIDTDELHSPQLLQYLKNRKIPLETAHPYCRGVTFELYGKRHSAIGFANNSGGYELRNAYFKGSSAPKDVTLISQGGGDISVFEGFFSFLSYQALHQNKTPELTNFLVLNSLSFLERSRQLMEKHDAVHLFLDRDAAGLKATQQALGISKKYHDQSHLYHSCKDLNDYLVRLGVPNQKQTLRRGTRL